MNVAKDRAY
jgi:hypothetical protein